MSKKIDKVIIKDFLKGLKDLLAEMQDSIKYFTVKTETEDKK